MNCGSGACRGCTPPPKLHCPCGDTCPFGIQPASCMVSMAAAMGVDVTLVLVMPKVQITEADEAEVSTATDYGAIVYPPHVSLQRVAAVVKSSNTYRVVSESQDAWRVEAKCLRDGYWNHCHTFVNPQSAYAWLEETGRV